MVFGKITLDEGENHCKKSKVVMVNGEIGRKFSIVFLKKAIFVLHSEP